LGGVCLFVFQAEDGIRDVHVTGVQTCALPIWPVTQLASWPQLALFHTDRRECRWAFERDAREAGGGATGEIDVGSAQLAVRLGEIGRAPCRERLWPSVEGESPRTYSAPDARRP